MVIFIVWKRSVWVGMSTLKWNLKSLVSFWGSIRLIRSFISKNSGSIGIRSVLNTRLAWKSFWIARKIFWKNRDLREIVEAWDLGEFGNPWLARTCIANCNTRTNCHYVHQSDMDRKQDWLHPVYIYRKGYHIYIAQDNLCYVRTVRLKQSDQCKQHCCKPFELNNQHRQSNLSSSSVFQDYKQILE